MATVFATSGAAITVAGTNLPGIIDATVSINTETIDITEVSETTRSFIGGVRNGTLSGNIYYNQGDTAVAGLETAAKNGTTVAIVFTVHSAATYSATGFVTSFSPSIAVNDVVRASFSIQFTGAISIA